MPRMHGLASPRGTVITALLALPPLLIAASASLWWHRLPSRLPTHWNGQGLVDGYSPLWELFLGCLVIATLAGAVALVFVNDSRNAADIAAPLIVAGVVSGTACSAWLTLASASLTPGTVLTASTGLLAVIGVAYAAPLWLAAGRPTAPGPSAPAIGIDVTVNDSACWVTSVRSPVMAVLGIGIVVMAGGAVWLSADDGGTPSVVAIITMSIALLLGAFTVSLSTLSVAADSRGLLIRSRLTRLVITRIQLSDIADARSEFIRPMQWGGWGYRILPGSRALVLSKGMGLVVTKRNGHQFAVTVDSAQRGAEMINSLLARGPESRKL